jgi:hypothetical protein
VPLRFNLSKQMATEMENGAIRDCRISILSEPNANQNQAKEMRVAVFFLTAQN